MRSQWKHRAGIAAVVVLGSGLAGGVQAAPDAGSLNISGSAGISLPGLDADHDGKVSKKEAGTNKDLAKKFETYDADKDGKLDAGEFALFEGSISSTGSTSSGTPQASPNPDPKP